MSCCKENVLLPLSSKLSVWWFSICLRLSCLLQRTRAAFRRPRVICCCLNSEVSTSSPTNNKYQLLERSDLLYGSHNYFEEHSFCFHSHIKINFMLKKMARGYVLIHNSLIFFRLHPAILLIKLQTSDTISSVEWLNNRKSFYSPKDFGGDSGRTGGLLTDSTLSSPGTEDSWTFSLSFSALFVPVPASRTSEAQIPSDASDIGRLSTENGTTGT